jgi:hypothetical protein
MKTFLWRVRRSTLLVVASLLLGLLSLAVLFPVWRSGGVLLAAAGVTLGVLAVGAVMARWVPRRMASAIEIGGWAALVAAAAWLAWDPAPAQPYEPLVPLATLDRESSHSLHLVACRGGACEQWPEIFTAGSILAVAGPSWKGGDFADLVAGKTDEISAAWNRATPGRAWMAEVNAQPVFSDHVDSFASPILRFQTLRSLARVHCLRAASLALENRGDEALATLVPLAELSGRLREGGRALVTVMIATVLDGMMTEHARFVLEHSDPSPASRGALALALERGAQDGSDLARAVLCEADRGVAIMTLEASSALAEMQPKQKSGPDLRRFLASSLVFNRHAFAAALRAHALEMAELTRTGDTANLKQAEEAFAQQHAGIHFKNPVGHAVLSMMVPAYEKVAKTFHERLVQRHELAVRLRDAPPASVAQTDSNAG